MAILDSGNKIHIFEDIPHFYSYHGTEEDGKLIANHTILLPRYGAVDILVLSLEPAYDEAEGYGHPYKHDSKFSLCSVL